MTILKLLILSDSHGDLNNMRLAIEYENPRAVFHLGDHDSDAAALARKFPNLPFYYVSGNCDGLFPCASDQLLTELEGVRILAVHGHKHNVKFGMMSLYMAAQEKQAQLVLFGHTHRPFAEENGGIHFLNPGSCKGYGASYGLAYIHEGKVVRCETLPVTKTSWEAYR